MTSSHEYPIGAEVARQAALGAYPALRARGVFGCALRVAALTEENGVGRRHRRRRRHGPARTERALESRSRSPPQLQDLGRLLLVAGLHLVAVCHVRFAGAGLHAPRP
jgi:hypothetical protein